MTLTINEFIEYFWKQLSQISKDTDNEALLEKLLLQVVDYSKELFSVLKNDNRALELQQMPLLAMISEIQLISPETVQKLAEGNKIISKAQQQLASYDQEKRLLLRKYFLNRDNQDIIYLNNYRK